MKEDPEPVVNDIIVRQAIPKDVRFVYEILNEMARSARERGTGITSRTPQQLSRKIYEGKAVIAVTTNGSWAGFSYFDLWSANSFISNSGLIVNPVYRKNGVASRIKNLVFRVCRKQYPAAKLFSITTGKAVMKMNHELGFIPVPFGEIPSDQAFWDQCRSCVNYPTLESKTRTLCFCTAMLFDPAAKPSPGPAFSRTQTVKVQKRCVAANMN